MGQNITFLTDASQARGSSLLIPHPALDTAAQAVLLHWTGRPPCEEEPSMGPLYTCSLRKEKEGGPGEPQISLSNFSASWVSE